MFTKQPMNPVNALFTCSKWRFDPPLYPEDTRNLFIRLFTKVLQEDNKDQTKATISATYRYTYQTHKGVTVNRATCTAIIPTPIM
jgi:hypothetical protein